MARYTSEQKAQALQSMAEIGVVKTKEALGISAQTLYKWKNESNPTQAEPKEIRRGRKAAPLSEAIADAKAEARACSRRTTAWLKKSPRLRLRTPPCGR